MRPKHPKDRNHGKNGWVAGNPRHNRKRLASILDGRRGPRKDHTMGRN